VHPTIGSIANATAYIVLFIILLCKIALNGLFASNIYADSHNHTQLHGKQRKQHSLQINKGNAIISGGTHLRLRSRQLMT
jgi:hypothetical protein